MRELLENHVGPVGQAPYYDFRRGQAAILASESGGRRVSRELPLQDLDLEQSILSQRKDPDRFPELTGVGVQFGHMRFFQEFDLAMLRQPQKIDLPNDFLLPDGSNLGLVLNDMKSRPQVKRSMLEKLKVFYERVEDFDVKILGGTVQVFFHEEGLHNPVPAPRLSDGTLRFLCLLSILCHPQPPPLVGIEEPELGLHPDAITSIADLLMDASARTQLVVTTHSDALVSALSGVPEAIVVCERDENGTTLRRLEPARLAEWLERYRLGELWRMGEIGGTRW
jgi:predicted ATPase